MSLDIASLAEEFAAAYAAGTPIASTPTARDVSFDVASAYAVEAELLRRRRLEGRTPVGRKVGFANKAMWRVLKLDTLVWAHMYDDTVVMATNGKGTLTLGRRFSPRIEPEMVFKLKAPLAEGTSDAAVALAAVDWMAIGFEVIDCLFPDWKFHPADFVAAYGLHTALIVGAPLQVTQQAIPALIEALPKFTLRLTKNGELVEEGSGKNSLRSPALCLGELAGAIAKQSGATLLAAGELISTGTLTAAPQIAAGESWRVDVNGLDLAPLELAVR